MATTFKVLGIILILSLSSMAISQDYEGGDEGSLEESTEAMVESTESDESEDTESSDDF